MNILILIKFIMMRFVISFKIPNFQRDFGVQR